MRLKVRLCMLGLWSCSLPLLAQAQAWPSWVVYPVPRPLEAAPPPRVVVWRQLQSPGLAENLRFYVLLLERSGRCPSQSKAAATRPPQPQWRATAPDQPRRPAPPRATYVVERTAVVVDCSFEVRRGTFR